jgi:hypothetical protein
LFVNEQLFLYLHQGGIQKACINGTGIESVIRDSSKSLVEDLTIDWVNEKIVWTNPKIKSIEVANLEDGEDRKIIEVNSNGSDVILDMPRAMAVDPRAG